ncbi:MAG: PIN domain-containing protein [Candidatus Sungbacteria bacterium]|nr:PIN domain-containing protein [Candidatus Sungbacteria bacterium]
MWRIILIDSSVFVASLLEDDPSHTSVRRFFALFDARDMRHSVVEPATVILEVANTLMRLGHHKEASDITAYFSSAEIVPIDSVFIVSALPLLKNVNLKTADALIAVAAHLSKATLITLDKKLLREAKKITPAATPEEYVKKWR